MTANQGENVQGAAPESFPQPPMVVNQPGDMGEDREAPPAGEESAYELPEGQWPRQT